LGEKVAELQEHVLQLESNFVAEKEEAVKLTQEQFEQDKKRCERKEITLLPNEMFLLDEMGSMNCDTVNTTLQGPSLSFPLRPSSSNVHKAHFIIAVADA
jgi:hypothetical protein